MIQIDEYGDCARFNIRNRHCTEKISIFLMKMIYNIKIYVEVYHLRPGFGKNIVSTKNY